MTLAALKAHQARQAEEKAIVGPGYHDSGLVCTMPDGLPIHPQTKEVKRRSPAQGWCRRGDLNPHALCGH